MVDKLCFKKTYEIRRKGSEEDFFSALSSGYAVMNFNACTREMMKLAYLIEKDQTAKIKA